MKLTKPNLGGDGAWAWLSLGVAFVLALVVAPWDARTNVAGGLVAGPGDGLSSPTPGPTVDPVTGQPLDPSTPGPVTGTTGPFSPTPTISAGPTTGPTQSPRAGVLGRGVTSDSVRVGFITLKGQEESANELGFGGVIPSPGDPEGQIRVLTKWVNDNGGIGGKRLVPFIRSVDMRTSSTPEEQQVCTGFTQADNVFAVVLWAQIREVTRTCYADANVLTFDPSGFPMSGQLYKQHAPYLWSPSYPTISQSSRALPAALKRQGFWSKTERRTDQCTVSPCRTGVLMYDFPNYEKVLEQDLRPALKKVGIEISSVQRVDASDAATIQQGLTNATVQFQAAQITRVLFIGGAPLAPFFMVIAKQQEYRPIYGLTSFDQPRFGTDNRNLAGDQIDYAMGIGFAPSVDVRDTQWGPKKYSPMWKKCLQIYEAGGHTFPGHGNARTGVGYCESMLFLKHVADRIAPNLTAELWSNAASLLGTDFQTATGLGVRFHATHRAGGDLYRDLRFDPRCPPPEGSSFFGCFEYAGKTRKM